MILLERLRIEAGMSRAKLEREAGVSKSVVGQIEMGRLVPGPTSAWLTRLAGYLSLTGAPTELLMPVSDEDEVAALKMAREKGLR